MKSIGDKRSAYGGDIKEIVDRADMIINRYAFTDDDGKIRLINLYRPDHGAVICDGKLVETTMDDIENKIVMKYYKNSK